MADYQGHVSAMERNEAIANSLYAASAVAVCVGGYLLARSILTKESSPITPSLSTDGEGVALTLFGSF